MPTKTSLNNAIATATKQRRILLFDYHGHLRSVEPHLYGVQAASAREILYGYQIGGTSDSRDLPSWRSFYVEDITHLRVTEALFIPQGYMPAEPRVSEVFARA